MIANPKARQVLLCVTLLALVLLAACAPLLPPDRPAPEITVIRASDGIPPTRDATPIPAATLAPLFPNLTLEATPDSYPGVLETLTPTATLPAYP